MSSSDFLSENVASKYPETLEADSSLATEHIDQIDFDAMLDIEGMREALAKIEAARRAGNAALNDIWVY